MNFFPYFLFSLLHIPTAFSTDFYRITQYIEVTLKTLYRSDVDPEWLKCQPLEPAWNRDQAIELRQNVFSSLYGTSQGGILSETLIHLQSQSLVKGREQVKETEYACIHYLMGNCRFAEDCMNLHSVSAPRPPCRFHLRASGCTNENCVYSHNEDPATNANEVSMIPPTLGKFHGGAYAWYCQDSSALLLLGNDGIDQSLEALGSPPGLVLGGGTTSELVHFHKNRYLLHQGITKCAWNFPAASSSGTDEENESIIRGFFMSASAYFQSKLRTMSHLEVGLTLEGNQFSKWSVMHCAQHAGFCLEWYEDFDPAIFPGYMPRRANNDPMQTQDAKFYVFRMKKNVLHEPRPKMMEIRQGTQFGIELEMSSAGHCARDEIAHKLSHNGIIVENIEDNWSEAKKTSYNWKIVHDGSLNCNLSQPDCNKFELVSPILRSEKGLHIAASVLKRLSNFNVAVNRSMGFHVHFDVRKYSISDLIKICQQFIKYEHAIDSMLPHSRRTGSTESSGYFNSNTKLAKEALDMDEEGVLYEIGLCQNCHDLANILNPVAGSVTNPRYFKLNLQNLVTGRQPTIEFRQHSSTANHEKIDAWVRFIVRFCENSVSSEKPTCFANTLHSIDDQFDDLFKNVIRDSVLYSYYRGRRHLLSFDKEGEACCHGCVTGQECSK